MAGADARRHATGHLINGRRLLAGAGRRRDAALGGRLAPRILPYRIGVADTADARRVMDSLATMGVDLVKFRTIKCRWAAVRYRKDRRARRPTCFRTAAICTNRRYAAPAASAFYGRT